ncbi:hypothetical protein NL676_029908 [Syzygium grande]|nr:hypothetical protein NL676_029908 [Syzygium grande]
MVDEDKVAWATWAWLGKTQFLIELYENQPGLAAVTVDCATAGLGCGLVVQVPASTSVMGERAVHEICVVCPKRDEKGMGYNDICDRRVDSWACPVRKTGVACYK